MTTRYRRTRYHGDRSQQMLVGVALAAGWFACAALLGLAFADWLTGTDTLLELALQVVR